MDGDESAVPAPISTPASVILSEVSAPRSEALTQSKDPYRALESVIPFERTTPDTTLRRELPRIPFLGSDEASAFANSSPGGAAEYSPGRKSGVVAKKENNSTLPKAVAGERSSQATGSATATAVFRAFVKAGQRLAEIHPLPTTTRYPITK